MDTRLHFVPHPEVIAEERAYDFSSQPTAIIRYSAFPMLVRLRVGGADVFDWDWQGKRTTTMLWPLLHMSTLGRRMLRLLPETGTGRLDIPDSGGYITLELVGSGVRVALSSERGRGQAPYAELVAAWERFIEQVRAYLREECPNLADNPTWGAWLAGSDDEELLFRS